MAQNSVEVRNQRLASFEAAVGASPVLQFIAGNMPVDTATATAGTVLAEMTLPSDWMGTPSNGSVSKSGTWQDLAADAAGFAGYYRLWNSGKTVCHEQGLLGQPWAASTAFVVDQRVIRNGNVYRCTTAGTTAASGGPSGTGTGITDGSAVWAYVGAADMEINNTNIAVGQTVTVNSYTRTAGNA